MAITPLQPNTIWLGNVAGERPIEVGDLAAGVAICPGMVIERYVPSGTIVRVRPHATASVATAPNFAVEQSMVNKGVNDGYAIGDLVQSKIGRSGMTFWAIIASGQNIAAGQKLESAGDGTLKAYATLGAALVTATETVNNTTGSAGPVNPPPQTGGVTALPVGAARIRVEVL
jgi:hypothetical protein